MVWDGAGDKSFDEPKRTEQKLIVFGSPVSGYNRGHSCLICEAGGRWMVLGERNKQ